jgi:molybdate transport system substrate-binding protein
MLMTQKFANFRALALGFAVALLLSGAAGAAEVRVMISGGLTAAYKVLVPEFERATGHTVLTAYGPSMGTTANAIPIRLERGEPVDVLIMVGYALGDLAKQGKVIADSRVDLVKSPIGVAVKAGAPRPDISSADTLKRALLTAKTIAYSDSASGVYVSTEMFAKLGIADEMKDKARKIPATPVGEIVAHGDAEIGFQQISELLPVQGIDIVGPLPAEFRRDRYRLQGTRRGPSTHQVPRLTRGPRHHREKRHGSDPGSRDELEHHPSSGRPTTEVRYFVCVRIGESFMPLLS